MVRHGETRGFCGRALWAVALMTLLVACSHAPPPSAAPPTAPAAPGVSPPCATPEPLKLSLDSSPFINPGEKGEPLSVVVRIYQLKGPSTFQSASFDELLDKDKEVLGEDLVQVSEVTLNPNEHQEPPLARKPDAAYLAAVALFRRPGGQGWRALQRLPDPDAHHCEKPSRQKAARPGGSIRFFVDENRIELR